MADKTAAPEMSEFEKLDLEERKYRLEVLKENVAKIHAEKDQAARNRKRQAQTEETNRQQTKLQQDTCPHKKAGTGVKGVFAGGAPEYSVIKHTEPWGETYVMCSRCYKEWRDPYFMLRKIDPKRVSAAKKADPRVYAQKMKEYKWAIDLPTDNSPSGGAIFNIQLDMEYQSTSA
jgi:hypothetical protein